MLVCTCSNCGSELSPEDILSVKWSDVCKAELAMYKRAIARHNHRPQWERRGVLSVRRYARDIRQIPRNTAFRRIKLADAFHLVPELENYHTFDEAWKKLKMLDREGWIDDEI